MFEGLSAFSLTPMDERGIDGRSFVGLVARLAQAGVDSIGVLGSTGNYAYLWREERSRVARLAVEAADGTPVMVGVGAMRTRHVLELVEDAQAAGAAALLLAPVSYQPLRTDDLFDLYAQVDRHVSVPVCVYDNPDTTRFTFSDDLHRNIARLSNVQAIKIPAPAIAEAATRIPQLRELIGADAVVGVSGDSRAAASLLAGAPTWFSVIGGLLPEAALAITRAARAGDAVQAIEASARLSGLWELFETYGSLRVVATAAAQLGLTQQVNLPRPLQQLDGADRERLEQTLTTLASLTRTKENEPCAR
jgi:4-hydroxy-tetrahydrodipicolinate synthase